MFHFWYDAQKHADIFRLYATCISLFYARDSLISLRGIINIAVRILKVNAVNQKKKYGKIRLLFISKEEGGKTWEVKTKKEIRVISGLENSHNFGVLMLNNIVCIRQSI